MQLPTFDTPLPDSLLPAGDPDGTFPLGHQPFVFDSILDHLPTAVFWRNLEGQFIGSNKIFCEFIGVDSPAQLNGRKMNEVLHPSNQTTNPLSCFAETQADESSTNDIEEVIRDSEGHLRTILSRTAPLLDSAGNPIGRLGIFQDITLSKSTEASATAFATMIRESPNELYILDAETLKIVEANRGFSENIGVCHDKLVGTSPLDFLKDVSEEELREKLTGDRNDKASQTGFNSVHINEALAPGESQMFEASRVGFNSVHTRSDQSTYPVHVDISESIFEDRPVFVAFCSDLSEMQSMERQLHQAQKLESMGQLAAGVAHEINTPMQCVSGNIEFLTKANERVIQFADELIELIEDPGLPSETKLANANELTKRSRYDRLRQQTPNAIDESAQAVQRVIEIVRAMKVMAHPGKREQSDVEINTLLEQAAMITRNRWKFAAELELNLFEGFPTIQGFPAELSQVFINLIVNAADAIVERKESDSNLAGKIQITTSVGNGMGSVKVSDNGTGIPEEITTKVFDQFFTTKDVGKGTGMGLSISYDIIVNKHGGKIELDSEMGRGTEFIASFPLEYSCDDPE